MEDERFWKQFARQLVKIMLIGKKPNKEGITKARRKYRTPVSKLLKLKRFSLKEACKATGLSQERMKKVLEDLKSPRYGPLIMANGKRYRIKDKIGETVLLRFNSDFRDFALECCKECWRRGAHPIMLIRDIDDLVSKFKLSPVEAVSELPEPYLSLLAKTDVYISGTSESDTWKKQVSPTKLKTDAPCAMLFRELSDRYGQRWVLIGLPFKRIAKECGVPYPKFKKVLLASLKESSSPTTKKLVDYYNKRLSNKRVRITADDGTDLTMKLRRMLPDDGVMVLNDPAHRGMNLPAGESFTAIVEPSTNGKIFFKRILPHGYGIVDNIWLYFKNGHLINYKTSPKGMKIFKRMMDESTGGKDIAGELGIGCNRKAKSLGGFIIVDEKIFGTIHVAIGANKFYGGKNISSLHFDMIKDMQKCNGRIWVGNKLVMDKGLPIGIKF